MPVPKVPRGKIPWFPTVNPDACVHDRDCIEFCKNKVFDWSEALGEPIVARRYRSPRHIGKRSPVWRYEHGML